jgi:hypothetical protein
MNHFYSPYTLEWGWKMIIIIMVINGFGCRWPCVRIFFLENNKSSYRTSGNILEMRNIYPSSELKNPHAEY